MKVQSTISALALAMGALGVGTAAQAARYVDVEIGTPPPTARVEVVPAPREGYFYVPGHYESSDGTTYAWQSGRYIQNREGHRWVPYVMEHNGDRWHFRAGHWDDDD